MSGGQSSSFKRRSPSPLYDAPTREKNTWHNQVRKKIVCTKLCSKSIDVINSFLLF